MGFPDSSVGKKSVSRSVISDSTPNTVAYQALLSMGFSRQENWSGLPKNPLAVQETLVQFLGWEDPLEKG